MSHDNSGRERGALGNAFSRLTAADVAPAWDGGTVWQRLEGRLSTTKKRRFLLRGITLAAAASIACCMLLMLRAHQLTDIAWNTANMIPVTRQKAPVPALLHVATSVNIVADSEEVVAQPVSYAHKTSAQTEQALPSKDTLLPQLIATITPEPVTNEPMQSRIRRKPAIVYTLNEIMADLPEREAPPKRYSGIFHQKAQSADVPERSILRRRSAVMPEDETPVFPHLLN